MRRGGAALVGLTLALGLGAAACGTSKPAPAPGRLLVFAQAALNATPSVHFSISSSGDLGRSGITGGQGALVRPAGLTGTFDINYSGLPVTISVEAEGARFYVKAPFQSYKATNPATYGFGNPEQLLSTTHGLTAILAGVHDGRADGTTRMSGELLDRVAGSVAGTDIPVIPDVAPSKAVSLVADIDPTSHQLRQVTLTGPFVSASASTTYVVTLTAYGQPVSITLPTS